jgi:tRNA(Ile)-lysidine synthase
MTRGFKTERILAARIFSKRLVRPGERIGVAVSGGADSVALLRLMLESRQAMGIVVCAVHFNHRLRGKDSDADEKFVAKLAATHGVEFFVAREDVGAKAKRERANLEDAGRRARNAFFSELVTNGRVSRIAVAHTADDQAETVLAHILRGTGLAGLAGIHPEAGAVFRPLLKVRRAELRAYLRAKRQTWREDKTNKNTERTRARIRHELMPLLEKRFHEGAVEHLCQLAELAREDELHLEAQAELWEKSFVRYFVQSNGEDETAQLPLLEFSEQARAMKTRVIRKIVDRLKTRAGQLSSLHVESVLALAEDKESGKSMPVPGGLDVLRERNCLQFRRAASCEGKGRMEAKSYAYEVHLGPSGTELRIMEHGCRLHFRVIDWAAQGRETNVTDILLDRERLTGPLVVRNWQPGDAMRPVGHQKQHTLARLWNEANVSRWEKAVWPVLTSNGRVAWARGLRVATEFAVRGETRTGVAITLEDKS